MSVIATPPPQANPTTSPAATELPPFDGLLIVGFGGPEGPDEVMPFLENVLRGRNVPRERMLEVAEHYYHFGGVSPLNDQVRALIAELQPELRRRGVDLPIAWGNRNWKPFLTDAVRELTERGAKRVLAVVLAAYSSYSSCRQYRENVEAARREVAANLPEGQQMPIFEKMRVYYNHPDFIASNADRVREALERFPVEERDTVHVAFTAHSIPSVMADSCNYALQLTEACRLTAETLGLPEERWKLVYQSRSGRPQDPWLEPDILDHLDALHEAGVKNLIIHPIGFLSDHMEVMYDLDEEAKHRAEEHGMRMERAATVGVHPTFVAMLAELIQERITPGSIRRAIGKYGPSHDFCPVNCCLPPGRQPAPAIGGQTA